MGSKMVVVIYVMSDASLGILKIQRNNALPEFLLDCLPEPFALSDSFWVVASRNYVLNAFILKKLLEFIFSSPGEVLTTLVRQYFLRATEAIDPRKEGAHDEVRSLPKLERPSHDVATVVVKKRDEIASLRALR